MGRTDPWEMRGLAAGEKNKLTGKSARQVREISRPLHTRGTVERWSWPKPRKGKGPVQKIMLSKIPNEKFSVCGS